MKPPWNMPKSFSILALVVLAGAMAADFPRPWVRGPGEKWYLLAETAGMSWPDARRQRKNPNLCLSRNEFHKDRCNYNVVKIPLPNCKKNYNVAITML